MDPAAYHIEIKRYEIASQFDVVSPSDPGLAMDASRGPAAPHGAKPRLKAGVKTSAADLLGLPVPPPRQFVYGPYYQRGTVSMTVGRGAGAKTSLVLLENIAMAADQQLLHEKVYAPGLVVLHINFDETTAELHRRLVAACHEHLVPAGKVRNLHLIGRDQFDVDIRLLFIDPEKRQAVVHPEGIAFLAELIDRFQADVVVLDPIGNTLEGGENDNPTVHQLMRDLARLSETKRVALHLVHHSRKSGSGGPANGIGADDTRGAGAWINSARSVRTIGVMDTKAAKDLNVPVGERFRYHRIDPSAKANYVLPSAEAHWIKLASFDLQNAQGRLPSDSIGVPHVWTPPSVVLTEAVLAAILRHVRDGFSASRSGTGYYTAAGNSSGKSSVKTLLADTFGIKSEPQQAAVIERLYDTKGTPLVEDREIYCGHVRNSITRLVLTDAGHALIAKHQAPPATDDVSGTDGIAEE